MFAISNGGIACPFLSWGTFFILFANLHRPIKSSFFLNLSFTTHPSPLLPTPFLSTYLPTYPPPTNPFDLNPHHCLLLDSLRHHLFNVLPLDSLCDSIIRVTMPTFVTYHNTTSFDGMSSLSLVSKLFFFFVLNFALISLLNF